jgi:hypothetical protein
MWVAQHPCRRPLRAVGLDAVDIPGAMERLALFQVVGETVEVTASCRSLTALDVERRPGGR